MHIWKITIFPSLKSVILTLNGELEMKTSLMYSNRFFAKFRVLFLCCCSVALVRVNQTVQLFDGSSPLRRCQN